MFFVVIVKEPKVAKAKVPYAGSDATAAQKAFRKAADAGKEDLVELWRHERNGTARRFSVVDNGATYRQLQRKKADQAAAKKMVEAREKILAQAENQKIEDAKLLLSLKGFEVSDGGK